MLLFEKNSAPFSTFLMILPPGRPEFIFPFQYGGGGQNHTFYPPVILDQILVLINKLKIISPQTQ